MLGNIYKSLKKYDHRYVTEDWHTRISHVCRMFPDMVITRKWNLRGKDIESMLVENNLPQEIALVVLKIYDSVKYFVDVCAFKSSEKAIGDSVFGYMLEQAISDGYPIDMIHFDAILENMEYACDMYIGDVKTERQLMKLTNDIERTLSKIPTRLQHVFSRNLIQMCKVR